LRAPIFIDLRTVRQGQNPRLKFATYFAADRSFVLLHALKSCINGHRFQASLTPMSHCVQLHEAINSASKTLQSLGDLDAQLKKAADLIKECLRRGNKLLVCGNGGSAADAAHFATELVVRFTKDRPAQPAICLASDAGLLTAAANDYGFNEIFARQVAAFGMSGDVLICLTTSGKSKNVARALEEARARKLKTIALLGRDGGSTIGIADIDLLVKSDSTARIQEAHQVLLHVLCEIIESGLKE
jgi:D-sedoheptulose 7-phosphate isomerase